MLNRSNMRYSAKMNPSTMLRMVPLPLTREANARRIPYLVTEHGRPMAAPTALPIRICAININLSIYYFANLLYNIHRQIYEGEYA